MATNFYKIAKGLTLKPQSSAPTSAQDGDLYYDSTRATFVLRNNGVDIDLQKRSDVASAASLTSSNFTASVVQSSLIRLTGTTVGDVHGLTASSDAKLLFLYNNSNQTQTIKHQSLTESTAGNRIITSDGLDLAVTAGQAIQLGYDSNQARWVVLSSPGTSLDSSGTGKNYITNGDASAGTTGWTTYTSVLTVTAANVDTTANTFTIVGHGLPQGRRVQFTTSNTLPTPLLANTDYYVLNPTTNTFQVSSTVGGAAIDLTTQGVGTHSVKPARPVTVSGSSTAVQIFTTSTAPLEGLSSFLIQRTAPSMGEGVYKAFTIDNADKNRVLQETFDYTFDSGTYNNVNTVLGTDSDFICMIQDVTNGTFIEPSSIMIDGVISGNNAKFNAVFQTTNSTSYRLLIHSTQDLRTAVIKADNFKVSPQDYAYGNPITSGQSYTPSSLTLGGWGTVVNWNAQYERIGDSIHIVGGFDAGTVSAALGNIPLPNGLSVDTSKISSTRVVGMLGNGGSNNYYTAAVWDGTQVRLGVARSDLSKGIHDAVNVSQQYGNGTVVSFNFTVPVTGWSSSVQMSNETSTRVVTANYTRSSTLSVATATDTVLPFSTLVKDTHAAYNTSTGIYTIQVSGTYEVNAKVHWASSSAGDREIKLFKNGAFYRSMSYFLSPPAGGDFGQNGSVQVDCNVGDTLTIYVKQTSGGNLNVGNSGSLYNFFDIERISGPSQIAASENVAAKYRVSATKSFSTTVPINYDTKVYDTHGMIIPHASTWKATAPISGIYEVTVCYVDPSASSYLAVYKNGAIYDLLVTVTTATAPLTGTVDVEMTAGDYIDIRGNTAGLSLNTTGLTTYNCVTMKRLGNRG